MRNAVENRGKGTENRAWKWEQERERDVGRNNHIQSPFAEHKS